MNHVKTTSDAVKCKAGERLWLFSKTMAIKSNSARSFFRNMIVMGLLTALVILLALAFETNPVSTVHVTHQEKTPSVSL